MVILRRDSIILYPLPMSTKIFAHGADPIGDFGLVRLWLTNCYHDLACAGRRFLVGLDPVTIPYQPPDLALDLPRVTFTKLDHRDGGLGMTEYYIGLELVVGGAVDEGDVMLFFIG